MLYSDRVIIAPLLCPADVGVPDDAIGAPAGETKAKLLAGVKASVDKKLMDAFGITLPWEDATGFKLIPVKKDVLRLQTVYPGEPVDGHETWGADCSYFLTVPEEWELTGELPTQDHTLEYEGTWSEGDVVVAVTFFSGDKGGGE